MQKLPMVSRKYLSRKSNAFGLLLLGRGEFDFNFSKCRLQLHLAPQIRNSESQNCLDTMGHKSGEKVGSSYCHGLGGNQVFAYTKRQQIMSDDNCLDASNANGPVNLVRCHGMGGNQEWSYNENVKPITISDLRRSYKNFPLFRISL